MFTTTDWIRDKNGLIDNYRGGSNVDFFAGTFTKDGKTYLAVAIIGKSMV